ncbi:MAG: murein L,D-transpeptidase family protein [Ignavibacteriaceae bacterium]
MRIVRNIVFLSGGLLLFIAGVILYGIILNIRENTLAEEMATLKIDSLKNVTLQISLSKYKLYLYSDSILVKRYRISAGRDNYAKKEIGDNGTPVGEYRICRIDSNHKFHRYFRIDYPNLRDIEEAYLEKSIDSDEYHKIRRELLDGECPTRSVVLGGDLGIHGIGKLNNIFKNLPFIFNWTNGSIAMSDENIDELFRVVKNGTKIIIKK